VVVVVMVAVLRPRERARRRVVEDYLRWALAVRRHWRMMLMMLMWWMRQRWLLTVVVVLVAYGVVGGNGGVALRLLLLLLLLDRLHLHLSLVVVRYHSSTRFPLIIGAGAIVSCDN
jgi:hypothetical protein